MESAQTREAAREVDVSIITSLYNRLDLTRVYLESLERTLAGWRYEVILIDDGSTDGTREFLPTLPAERYRVILNETGRGFAANNNVAARLARAPLLCLLNNDTILLPGWLEPMARLARRAPGVACVGNVQREPVSGLIDHFGVYFWPEDGNPLHAGKNLPTMPREAYLCWPVVTAACCVIRKAVFEELGGFDEAYRNGFEDVDFCLRARERGYRHFVANRSVIYHHVSASPGRYRHEDANHALFQTRWAGRVPMDRPPPEIQIAELRQEGQRYLRKHLHHPWRYNLGRFVRALRQRLTPWPPGARIDRALHWRFALEDFAARFTKRAGKPSAAGPAPTLFLVVNDTVQNPGRSGIQTVVRRLAAALGRRQAAARTVVWDRDTGSLHLLPPTLSAGLEAEPLREPAAPSQPLHHLPGNGSPPPGSWIVMPELLHDPDSEMLVEYIHRHGWKVALVFYDAIPVTDPGFVTPERPALHAGYMRAFSRADLILPISEASASDWREFVAAQGLPQAPVSVCTLAADLSGTPRVRPEEIAPPPSEVSGPAQPVRILCVSTIEPRKNHRALLAAYELAAARPGPPLELHLVGAPYLGAEDLTEEVERFIGRHPERVTWHKQVEYSQLRRFYAEADFTVYPSVLEGFGLPIIESLWFGRPCVCADFGVMAENAAGGGCVTVDVRNPKALAEVITSLAASPEKRRTLALEGTARRLKTWDEYAAEVLGRLSTTDAGDKANRLAKVSR